MNKYDFYDYEKADRFRTERSRKYIALVKKWHDAKEKNDEVMKRKAIEDMSKHKKQDEKYKAMAEEAGYCFY